MPARTQGCVAARGAAWLALAAALSAPSAVAADGVRAQATCLAYDARYEEGALMQIDLHGAAKRAHMQSKARRCPPAAADCPWRLRSSVPEGGVALVGAEVDGFRCAYFGLPSGRIAAGFLPADVLVPAEDGGDLGASFLLGTWLHDGGNRITFTSAGGALRAQGSARWQGRPGIVHHGGFRATAAPTGDTVELADPADGSGCKVTLRRRGPYLIARDDQACGGANVRFQGVYVKQLKGK